MDSSLVEVGSTGEMAEALRASGAVDDLLAQIDTGEVVLTGERGLLPGLTKLGPQLAPKGARRIGRLDDMIISLYAGGMTLRDMQFHLASRIGTEVSHETISKIVDEISEEVSPGSAGHWNRCTR